jgi:hypothetical protein
MARRIAGQVARVAGFHHLVAAAGDPQRWHLKGGCQPCSPTSRGRSEAVEAIDYQVGGWAPVMGLAASPRWGL